MLQAVDVVLDHDDDDDDMNPDANGAVVINMGGHHPEDGMVEAGIIACHLSFARICVLLFLKHSAIQICSTASSWSSKQLVVMSNQLPAVDGTYIRTL